MIEDGADEYAEGGERQADDAQDHVPVLGSDDLIPENTRALLILAPAALAAFREYPAA